MWQWLVTFAIVRIMPEALNNIGSVSSAQNFSQAIDELLKQSTYFVFGSIFACATPFVYFLIPYVAIGTFSIKHLLISLLLPTAKPRDCRSNTWTVSLALPRKATLNKPSAVRWRKSKLPTSKAFL